MDRLNKEQRRKNMQHVRNKDSEIELKLRRELWHAGFRYRKNVREVFDCPDIVFKKLKIAVFVDSEFWHDFFLFTKIFKAGRMKKIFLEKKS